MMRLICAVKPRAKGSATDQKCTVRRKSRPLPARSTAGGFGSSVSEGRPSRPSPSASGPRTSSHEAAITSTSQSTPAWNPRLAAAGGVGTVTRRSQTVEADVQHGAKQIAKELAKLFVQQGWIAQEQADRLFWDR